MVTFHFNEVKVTLKDRQRLKSFIGSIFKQYGKELESLNYVFCSDKYLLKINRDFLNHDYYTDIITFDLSAAKPIIGEIYISVERVRDNALQHGSPFFVELQRVIFHGALHLCGLRDKTRKEKLLMTKAENEMLSAYFRSTNHRSGPEPN